MRSRKSAIDSFCFHCIYDPVGGRGTWRQQVEDCTSCECSLFPYRPKPTNTKKQQSKREERVLSPKGMVATNCDLIAPYSAKKGQIATSAKHKEREL